MKLLPDGTELDLLVGLGNGYNIDGEEKKPLLVGGGDLPLRKLLPQGQVLAAQ